LQGTNMISTPVDLIWQNNTLLKLWQDGGLGLIIAGETYRI